LGAPFVTDWFIGTHLEETIAYVDCIIDGMYFEFTQGDAPGNDFDFKTLPV